MNFSMMLRVSRWHNFKKFSYAIPEMWFFLLYELISWWAAHSENSLSTRFYVQEMELYGHHTWGIYLLIREWHGTEYLISGLKRNVAAGTFRKRFAASHWITCVTFYLLRLALNSIGDIQRSCSKNWFEWEIVISLNVLFNVFILRHNYI